MDESCQPSQAFIDGSHAATIVNLLLGSSVIGGALSFFTSYILDQQSEWEEATAEEHRANTRATAVGRAAEQLGRLPGLDKLAQRVPSPPRQWRMICVIVVSLVSGILFGVLKQEWTFIQSLYFAISSMSTAGLQAVDDPTSEPEPPPRSLSRH